MKRNAGCFVKVMSAPIQDVLCIGISVLFDNVCERQLSR